MAGAMPVCEDLLEDLSGDGHPVEGEVSGQDHVDKLDKGYSMKLSGWFICSVLFIVCGGPRTISGEQFSPSTM